MSKKNRLITAAAAAVTAFIAYLPAIGNGFVLWDDNDYILDNPFIRSLDFAFIRKAFTTVVVSNWHPLTVISYAVDYRLWGLNPFWYHLDNVVFHALNAFLAALLAGRLHEIATGEAEPGSSAFAGLTTGLLFAIHPLHVESVAWVSARKDVLYAFFFLLSILSYLKYARSGKVLYYLLTLVLFALSLMSKPMAITLPLVLLTLDFYPLERLKKGRAVVEKLPFFALSLASAVLTLWAQTEAMVPLGTLPFYVRAAAAIRAYAFYIYKTVLPFGLAPFYPMPADPFDRAFAFSAIVISGIAGLALWYRRKKAFIAASIYYIVTLVPVIGIVQAGGQAAADRYTYLPLLGFFMLTGALAARLFKVRKTPAMAALLVAVVLLSALTIRQIGVWKDSLTLWSWELEIYPKVPLAFNQRGIAFMRSGDYGRAIEDFDNAIRLNGGIPEFYYNSAAAYSEVGEYLKAIDDYSKAISLKPDYGLAYFNRGGVYIRLKRYSEALGDYDMVVILEPTSQAYINRGIIKMALGNWAPALEDFKKAAGLAPDNAQAWWDMGAASSKLGDAAGAELYFNEARRRGFGGLDGRAGR